MTVRTLRCTDRAYDALLAKYGTDNSVWTAVYAAKELSGLPFFDGEHALRSLCRAHRINPDA